MMQQLKNCKTHKLFHKLDSLLPNRHCHFQVLVGEGAQAVLQLSVGNSAGASWQGGVVGRRQNNIGGGVLIQAVRHCPELDLLVRSVVAHRGLGHPVGLQTVGHQSVGQSRRSSRTGCAKTAHGG